MRHTHILLLLLCFAWHSPALLAQKVDLGLATRSDQLPEWRRKRLEWTTKAWTGDDRPFQVARQDIDKAVASGRQADDLMKNYEKAVMQKPNDALAVFKWSYAAWLARNRFSNEDEQFKRIGKPREALRNIAFPRPYQFARLRFLVEAWSPETPQFLIPVGDKLLQRNPQDYDVKYYLARLLLTSPNSKQRQRALTYIREFIAQKPQKASYHSLLGGFYFRQWEKSKSRADAANAIKAYKKYLELAPPDDEWREQAQRLINLIQRKTPA